jgi:copper resistance protein C
VKRGKLQQLLLLTFGICLGINANAQPFSSSVHKQPADITGIVSKTEFNPPNDAVLMAAPQHINIKFPSAVHLVKLTLRNELRDWVDISFRYSPIVNADFQWVLPDLEPAVYYTADWAILSANDRLVRGSFSFSFGPDAKAPSASRAAEEALLQQRYGDPNIRYVAPPATEIIINQDPPSYDPPFTIQLEIDQDN